MALTYETYYALPSLRNYQQARDHHDKIKPIRGDAHETRPVGRRDQKWMSIWEDPKDKSIHVGYGARAMETRTPLVSYRPDGGIEVCLAKRWHSAPDNERIQRLLGTSLQTHQYDTWISCHWYDDGVKNNGMLPLLRQPQKDKSDAPTVSKFTRDGDGHLVFVNYKYPRKHKINRERYNEATKPLKPFINYVTGLQKLQGNDRLELSEETKAEYFGWSPQPDWRGQRVANKPPNLNVWPIEQRPAVWQQCVAWMRSDNVDDWMRAAIAMSSVTYDFFGSRSLDAELQERILREDITLFDEEVVKTGKLVRDKHRRYFLG